MFAASEIAMRRFVTKMMAHPLPSGGPAEEEALSGDGRDHWATQPNHANHAIRTLKPGTGRSCCICVNTLE